MTRLLRTDSWFPLALAINSRSPHLAHQALYGLVLAFSSAPSLTLSSYTRTDLHCSSRQTVPNL